MTHSIVSGVTEPDDALAMHLQELRRGTVVLACLALLGEPRYGYALLEELDGLGLKVDGNTLYPLLRRLESQGLLQSEWNTDESRPRKFYQLTAAGSSVANAMAVEWRQLDRVIESITRSER